MKGKTSGKKNDLIGKRFSKLVAIEIDCECTKPNTHWLCLCDCGNYKSVDRSNLLRGNTKSCGCLNNPEFIKANQLMYNRWQGIIQRTKNPKSQYYRLYGGRGIDISDEWFNSFETFLNDMVGIPFDGAELDRINTDGDYSKENCRWVTGQQNIWNKRKDNNVKNVTSKYKGVNLNRKTNTWRARIQYNGVKISLGYFKTQEEAGLAYNKKAIELFGEYAHLNKIETEYI